MTTFALFRDEAGLLVPQDIARSLWRADQMHGVATSGALAREVETTVAAVREDLQPTRFTVDLFRAPSMDPCRVESNVVREGSRLLLVDAVLHQGGVAVARAIALFLKASQNPSGSVWAPGEEPSPPPLEVAPVTDEPRVPFFYSDEVGWSQDFAAHQNASRKQTWQTTLPIVAGEPTTPFQGLAGAADSASMVLNWGSEGVQYINTDITLAISRLPTGREIGLAAAHRSAYQGIASGTAVVFDRDGTCGTVTVSSLANARRSVDFTALSFGADSVPSA